MRSLIILLTLFSTNALGTTQYNESVCLLLDKQVKDYEQRLGTNSPLYKKNKSTLSKKCAKPTPVISKTLISDKTQPTLNKQPIHQTTSQKKSLSQTILNTLLTLWPIALLLALIAFLRLPATKGKLGELLVSFTLKAKLNNKYYTIINNVTLPLEDGGTTQIDHIVLSRFGIFVIETKNMKGWIFGNENQAKWTQTIFRKKHSFQNPLRQNYKHTKQITKLLKIPEEKVHSVVIFTPAAELKTVMPDNVGYAPSALTYITRHRKSVFNDKEVKTIESQINNLRLNRGYKTDRAHVKYLDSKFH